MLDKTWFENNVNSKLETPKENYYVFYGKLNQQESLTTRLKEVSQQSLKREVEKMELDLNNNLDQGFSQSGQVKFMMMWLLCKMKKF